MKSSKWEIITRNLLRKEIKTHQISYCKLAKKLNQMGVYLTEEEIKQRIKNGYISSGFLMQCLYVIGVNTIDVGAILKEKKNHDV